MGILVQWENAQKTAVRQIFDGSWSWEDYGTSIQTIRHMLQSVPHTVDVISDIRASMPQIHGRAWEHFRSTIFNVPTNMGLIVVAGKGHFTASLFCLIAQTSPQLVARTHFVPTLAEAYATLAKMRSHRLQ